MKLSDASVMIRSLMDQHGLCDWQFKWSRSKRTFGMCYSRFRIIVMSPYLVELNPEEETKDTILHEIAHALVGANQRHNRIWKAKAKEIGARPEACNYNPYAEPPHRWHGTCVSCGVVVKRDRVSKRMRVTGFHPSCRKNGVGGEINWRENVVTT